MGIFRVYNVQLAVFFIAMLFICLVYIFNFKRIKFNRRQKILSCVIFIYLFFYTDLFNVTTNNQPENGFVFLGILFAIGAGLLSGLFAKSSNFIKKALYIVILALMFNIFQYGVKISLNRYVHDLFKGSEFPKYFKEDKLKNLKWGYPTRYGSVLISEEDITNTLEYLKKEDRNFFVFSDFTIFYALRGAPSPQPLLFFYKDLSYAASDNSDLDNWVVDDLKRNKVEIVILEDAYLTPTDSMDDFPRLSSYIFQNFSKVKNIGLFNIYEKRK